MNQVQSLLETLTLQGINLWIDGEQLRYNGPKKALTRERLKQLKQDKSLLLQALTTRTYKAAREQQTAYVAYQATSHKVTHHVSFAAHLQGQLDKLAFERTWKTLGRRHTILRTIYHEALQAPITMQSNDSQTYAPTLFATVLGMQRLTLTQIHAQAWHEEELQAQIEVNQNRPFDLTQGPLLRIVLFSRSTHEQILLVTAPRITLNNSSLAQLIDEFGQLYSATQNGASVILPPVVSIPEQYAKWQASQLVNDDLDGSLEATDEELILNLPLDYPRQVQQGKATARQPFELMPDLISQLNALATNTETDLDTILLSAFQLLLYRYTGQNDLLLGISLEPSHHPDFGSLVGGFTTDVALHTDLAADNGNRQYFTALLRQTHRHLQAARTGQANVSTTSWQVAFTKPCLSRAWPEALVWGKLSVTPLTLQHTSDTVELKLELVEIDESITGTFYYRPDLFAPDTLRRMVGHFQTLLAAIVNNPQQPLTQISLLTEAERHQILVKWNNTAIDYPKDKCAHKLFEEQVERTPDAIAIVFDGGTARGERQRMLTYRELNQRANQLAHHLQSLGVMPERIVGICIERSIEMVVGLLGILKAGGAYLPLDPTYPQERIAFMLEDATPLVLLTQAHLLSQLPTKTSHILCIDEDWSQIATQGSQNCISQVQAEHLAYIIYTSGSTGYPKGVQIVHRALTNFLCAMQAQPGFTANDTLLSVTTLSFDIAGLELYLPIITGGQVILVDQETSRNGVDLAEAIVYNRATVMQATPATWRLLFASGWQGAPTLKLLCGGEALSLALANQLLSCGSELWNLYGPTETTIWSTLYSVCEDPKLIPIGQPIANTQVYVLDRALQLVPVGVRGELYISGDGIARGYLKRPELSAETFITNPFGQGKLYKTGDFARWLPNGNLEYLGRIDHQVKIRGFRIELGEIEAVLSQHSAVEEAVVSIQEESNGKRHIAYITPNTERAYPVCQLLRFEREGLLGDHPYMELPNGMNLFYQNRSELDFMYRKIFAKASYLRHGITLTDGSCVFDVGANIGLFTLFVHQQCNDATIYAFEPISPICDLLSLNTELYSVNANVLNYGIASESCSDTFTYYPHISGLSGRFANAIEEQQIIKSLVTNESTTALSNAMFDELLAMRLQNEQITCQFKTLSEVISEHKITQIDLLKIDVEKSEYDVLLGIAQDDWPKIKQVVLEVHDRHGRLATIQHLLEHHGFVCTVEQEAMLKESSLYNLYAIHRSVQSKENDIHSAGVDKLFSSSTSLIYDVKKYLREKLPDYMIPSDFVLLDKLPLTFNGKVDRKALPSPDTRLRTTQIAEPSNPVEVVIAQIWSETLNKTQIGIHDKFIDLGGHSLQAMQIIAKIASTFQVHFPLSRLFQASTVKKTAQMLVEYERKPKQMVKLARLQQRLSQLTK